MEWDWMVVEQSLEDELALEGTVREIRKCTNKDELQIMCEILLRTNTHQAMLLRQAVGHIAEFDAMVAELEP